MLPSADSDFDARYKNRFYGKYRAFVRDNNDPERLGRCRLEAPAVLGSGRENWSEWAAPCFPYGGNDDVGVFLVPEEGASVWAEFEGGNPQYPIWAGVWLAKSNPGEQPEESKRTCSSATCKDCEDKTEHAANRADHLEHGKYHGHPPYTCPRVKVLLKTETGHTIVADDKDGTEYLKIIDRAGQILHFKGRIKPEVQTGNAKRRGTKDAERGDQPDIDSDIVDKFARIELTDACRQYLRLEARKDAERIHLQSNDKTRSRWQKILIDTTKGREKVHIWGLGGVQEILIDSTAGKEFIRLTDKAKQTILMNAERGQEFIRLTDKAGQTILMNAISGSECIKAKDKAGQTILMNSASGQERIEAKDKAGSRVLMDANSGNIIVKSSSMVLIN